MNEEIEKLQKALTHALELNRLLSKRIEMLEAPVEDNGARMIAITVLLQAVVECSPNRDQIAQAAERMAALMQVQPNILAGPAGSTFRKVMQELAAMTGRHTAQ